MHTLTEHGVTWTIDLGSHIGRCVAESGRPYEIRLLEDVLAHGRPGAVAVDIGAHQGNHALWMALVCRMRVHAFEPDAGNVAVLTENARRNDADVVVHPVALGAGYGWCTLTGDAAWGTAKAVYGEGSTPVHPLDDYRLDDVAVVKVDVEGNEAPVLTGARATLSRSRPWVWAECGTGDIEPLRAVLGPLGYSHTATYGATPMTVWSPG